MPSVIRRICRARASLVVVDIQERLLPAIFEKERLVRNARVHIQGARILGLPVLLTEQYRQGLGPTVPEIAEAVAGSNASPAVPPSDSNCLPCVPDHAVHPIEKLTFSAVGVPAFDQALASAGVTDVVVCGIEAHVCVSQTCLDLLERQFRVFVVADAVSSRTAENRRLGLDRMRDAGATMVSTEMVLFELLERAGTPEFKQILPLVK